MSEPTNEVVDTQAAPYTEDNDEFVPDATDAMGTLDTSGTAGGEHENINSVTPVFEAARANDLQYAAAALDPNDDSVNDPGAVVNEGAAVTVTTAGGRTPEAGEQAVKDAAAAYEENPVEVEDPSLKASEDAADNAEGKDGAQVAAEVEGQQAATPGAAGEAKVQSDDAAQRLEAEGTKDTSGTSESTTTSKSTKKK
jgi:hypothetical protein